MAEDGDDIDVGAAAAAADHNEVDDAVVPQMLKMTTTTTTTALTKFGGQESGRWVNKQSDSPSSGDRSALCCSGGFIPSSVQVRGLARKGARCEEDGVLARSPEVLPAAVGGKCHHHYCLECSFPPATVTGDVTGFAQRAGPEEVTTTRLVVRGTTELLGVCRPTCFD